LQELKAIAFKLDLAEAFNIAYVGSRSSDGKQLKRWRTTLVNRINKLLGRETKTIWDSIGGKSRKM